MQVKLFEVRDRATMIAAIAVRASLADKQGDDLDARRFLLGNAGFNGGGDDVVFFGRLDDMKLTYRTEDWKGSRTMGAAAAHVAQNFDALTDGQVIDVRVLLGEEAEPARSDRFFGTAPDAEPSAAE